MPQPSELSHPETLCLVVEQHHLDTEAPFPPCPRGFSLPSSPKVGGPLTTSLYTVLCYEELCPSATQESLLCAPASMVICFFLINPQISRNPDNSFLLLNNIPPYGQTTFCLFIYPLMDIWVISTF